jgi:hypothetical protein
MASTVKRRVRRRRHRPSPGRMFGDGFYAPIVGLDMRVMHHFARVSTGAPLQFQSLECATFLRTFRSF